MTRRLVSFAISVFLVFTAAPTRADPGSDLPAAVRIAAAVKAGTLEPDLGQLYTLYAIKRPELLPSRYESDTPFHGTFWLHQARQAFERMAPGPTRDAMRKELVPGAGVGVDYCGFTTIPVKPNTIRSKHFQIEYDAAVVNNGPDGLDIDDYVRSLERTWATEIDSFGWPRPPAYRPDPVPGNRYPVRLEMLGPLLYGYVSSQGINAGEVGNNPYTPWDDIDAQASCMVLNADYDSFPGTPRTALDATTAHEFNHSIQFGMGALNGENAPDGVFVEGGATWMEDEVFDYSNDNYNYLWPTFADDMGEYDGSPYSYWITWRGITERYGSSRPGGGEDIMQEFWNIISRNSGAGLTAMSRALRRTTGVGLGRAYNDYAIAAKFLKPCAERSYRPLCFQEAELYQFGDGVQQAKGKTVAHGKISSVGSAFFGRIPDHYSLNWVGLPRNKGTSYRLSFDDPSEEGIFRVSVVCDTGSSFRVVRERFVEGADGGADVDPKGCRSVMAVVTNETLLSDNPSVSELRDYVLRTRRL